MTFAPPIRTFKRKVREADAILFASPEHNYSITAVMKNGIEWGNRQPSDRPWEGKPAGIISASSGPRSGVSSQMRLRQIMVDIDMYPINIPQLLVGEAENKFDQNLKLTDEQTRKILRELLASLVDWTRRLRSTCPDSRGTSKVMASDQAPSYGSVPILYSPAYSSI